MTRDAEGQLWSKLKTLFHDYEARCQKADRYEQVSNLGDDFGRKALDVISAAGFRFVPPDHVVVPRDLLNELVDELEGNVEAQYDLTKDKYPSEKRRYERDIAPVRRARALVAASTLAELEKP